MGRCKMNDMDSNQMETEVRQLGEKLSQQVLQPMKEVFIGKDEIIDLLGIGLVARENLFILGPPGTAKSALVQQLASRIDGKVFDYLLTRFSEPNEIFGPFDIRRLREGELVTNTEGMLPEATFVFLDELLNANSAILNSLLLVLNERVFRRGRETRKLPTLTVVGASNSLPQDDALGALFDRFLLRVRSDNVHREELANVLSAGWKLDQQSDAAFPKMTVDEVQELSGFLSRVDLTSIRDAYVELIHRLRHAGIAVSDRRAVKLQRVIAASALLCGRLQVNLTDLWVLRHIWDTEEQQEVIAGIVDHALQNVTAEDQKSSHPQSRGGEKPNAERLAEELDKIERRIVQQTLSDVEHAYLRDQLGILSERCQWISELQEREFLHEKSSNLLTKLGVSL